MPRASVITSIYNGKLFLEGFLENVLEQESLEDMEVLLLDAQSTDATQEICAKYNHPSLKYERLPTKMSIYETWNYGVKKSTAPIISNWNLDDRRSPNSLIRQVQVLENTDADVCYGYTAWSIIPNERFFDNPRTNLYPCYDVTFETMMENNSPHCMPVWKKSLHNRFGYFDTQYPTAADFDFWMRCLAGGAKFQKIYDVVGLYYYNPNGLSTNSQSSNMREGTLIKQKFCK